MSYYAYPLHQIERVKGPSEVLRADERAARLVSAVSLLFRGIAACAIGPETLRDSSARRPPPGMTGWPTVWAACEFSGGPYDCRVSRRVGRIPGRAESAG